jgi:hypothetical protein
MDVCVRMFSCVGRGLTTGLIARPGNPTDISKLILTRNRPQKLLRKGEEQQEYFNARYVIALG